MVLAECVSQDNAQELDNTSEEAISFRGRGIERFSLLHTEDIFEGTNRTLNSGSFAIEFGPFGRAAQNAWIEAQISTGVDVNAASAFGIGTGIFAVAAEGMATD